MKREAQLKVPWRALQVAGYSDSNCKTDSRHFGLRVPEPQQ